MSLRSTLFTGPSECRKAIESYLDMRHRYGEVIKKSTPLVREQFDKRDQFSIANPRHIKEDVLMKKLTEMAEAAGLRTRTRLEEGQKPGSQTKDIPICNGFRRFYSSQLVNSGVITEKRWLLEGHNLRANDSSYVKISPDDLLEQFEKAHDDLVIEPSARLQRKVHELEIERNQFDMLVEEIREIKKVLKTN